MNRALVTDDVGRAVEVLASGGLVAIPTETVYGLAARADDVDAVARVYRVKRRPFDHPLIVHVASLADAERVAVFDDRSRALAARFWPGPLTLLLPRRATVPDVVTGARETVAVRIPDHLVTLAVLRQFPAGVVAPSANRFGKVSPTSAAHVVADLGDDVDLVLDGGPCALGVESTIVDCTVTPPMILRPGGVTETALRETIGDVSSTVSGPSRAPGMLASHYAPRCRVLLAASRGEAEAMAAAESAAGSTCRIIDLTDNPEAYARDLYDLLRRADTDQVAVVVAVMPSDSGLGAAVRDRLTKAAYRPSNDGSRFSR